MLAGARALEQRRELDQLEVAHDRVRDVEVGVEAQLAEPAADLRDGRQQLVAQHPERRLQRLGRAEQLLLARLPLAADRRARLLGERRRLLQRAALGALRVGEHEPPPRARHRDVQQPPHLGDVGGLACPAGTRLLDQRVGDRLERAPARAGHARGHQAEHVDVVELAALGRVHRHHLHAARALAGRRLLLAQPGLGDRGDRARELARGGLRRAAHVGGGELGEAGEVAQPLDDLGRGGEQQLAAQPEPLDQPVHVEVGAGRVERRRRRRGSSLQERARSARAPRAGSAATRARPPAPRPCRACAGGRSGSRARGRSPAAPRAGARARARPRRRRRGRRAAAARRAGRAPRRAGRTPRRRDSRYGTARSSNATATAWPSPRTERTSTHTSSGATSSRATSRSTSAATACACARSFAQRQNATSPPALAVRASFSSRSATGATTARAARRIRSPGSDATPRAARPSPRGHSARKSRMFLVAAPRKRWIAWSSSATAVMLPCSADEQPQQQALGEARVLQLVDEHVAVAARRAARARAASSRSSRNACSTRSPKSSVPGLGQQPRRGRRRARRTRARARRARPRAARPAHARSPRRETSSSLRRSMRWTIAPSGALGLPRRSWWRSGSSSMRSSSIASRSAARDRRRERVEPGLERLVAQQARAEAVEGRDRELLVAGVAAGPRAARAARPRRPSRRSARAATPAARRPRPGQAKRSTSDGRLAGARRRRGRAAGRRDARRPRAAAEVRRGAPP